MAQLELSSLTTLAARRLGVDIPGAVAKSLGILGNAGVEIVADQLRITGEIALEVEDEDATWVPDVHAILTVYAGIGDTRIVVSNTRIWGLDCTRSRYWVDLLERGVSFWLAERGGGGFWAFYLTREDGFVVVSVPIEMAPSDIRLPYEEGVKIVRAIIDVLVEHRL
jgi:hypothetical protein